MRHRLKDWHKLWQPTEDSMPLSRPNLQENARAQAAQLPPLTIGQLAYTLKHLPDKACGPDAITTQLLCTALFGATPPAATQYGDGSHPPDPAPDEAWSSRWQKKKPLSAPSRSPLFYTEHGVDSGRTSSTSGNATSQPLWTMIEPDPAPLLYMWPSNAFSDKRQTGQQADTVSQCSWICAFSMAPLTSPSSNNKPWHWNLAGAATPQAMTPSQEEPVPTRPLFGQPSSGLLHGDLTLPEGAEEEECEEDPAVAPDEHGNEPAADGITVDYF